MSDLVGNPEDQFSHVAAHIKTTVLMHINVMYRTMDTVLSSSVQKLSMTKSRYKNGTHPEE